MLHIDMLQVPQCSCRNRSRRA